MLPAIRAGIQSSAPRIGLDQGICHAAIEIASSPSPGLASGARARLTSGPLSAYADMFQAGGPREEDTGKNGKDRVACKNKNRSLDNNKMRKPLFEFVSFG